MAKKNHNHREDHADERERRPYLAESAFRRRLKYHVSIFLDYRGAYPRRAHPPMNTIGEPRLMTPQCLKTPRHNISPSPRQEILDCSGAQPDSPWKAGREAAGNESIQRQSGVPAQERRSAQEHVPARHAGRAGLPGCRACQVSEIPPSIEQRDSLTDYRTASSDVPGND